MFVPLFSLTLGSASLHPGLQSAGLDPNPMGTQDSPPRIFDYHTQTGLPVRPLQRLSPEP